MAAEMNVVASLALHAVLEPVFQEVSSGIARGSPLDGKVTRSIHCLRRNRLGGRGPQLVYRIIHSTQ